MQNNKFNIPVINYPNYSLIDNFIDHWKFIIIDNLIKIEKSRYIHYDIFGIKLIKNEK